MSVYEYTVNGKVYRCEVSHKLGYHEQKAFRAGFEQLVKLLNK